MSNNKPLKNSTKLLVNLDKFIFLVNAADSLEEIEIIRDLCCDNYGNSKNFRLLIAVPSWPHPTALYFPYTFKGNRDFNKIIFDSLSASNLDDSLTILIKNSEILSKLTVNNIPIGQIIGCFRSNLDYPIKDLFIPPSSWLCYSKFFGDNNEY